MPDLRRYTISDRQAALAITSVEAEELATPAA
jgi:hypothetical protein